MYLQNCYNNLSFFRFVYADAGCAKMVHTGGMGVGCVLSQYYC